MTVIWKFPFRIASIQHVDMPKGAEIVACQMQHGAPCLWAKCDMNAEKEPRPIIIHGTGHYWHDDIRQYYVGTIQDGEFVWHIFEGDTPSELEEKG